MNLKETLDGVIASGKRVLVVGLGISGVESARFLMRRGIEVIVVEKQPEAIFLARSKFLSELQALKDSGVEVCFGVDGEGIVPYLNGAGLALVSPGVPIESAIVGALKRHGIPYAAELELGLELYHGKSIVVTGSNGKSTTASLIDHIIKHADYESYLCGNIGVPVISHEELLGEGRAQEAVLVVEASSYQLEACTLLKPDISVVLNITDNHLERHGSLERYGAAKARALRLQSAEDLAVVNADDSMVLEMASSCRASLGVFGTKSEADLAKLSSVWAHISYSKDSSGTIFVSRKGVREEYPTRDVKLLGCHNRYNMAAAILVARHIGVAQAIVQEGLESFSPLEHRLELVWKEDGRIVINDSKSTTVAASLAALNTVLDQSLASQVVLMIGGLSKAGSWRPLLSALSTPKGSCASVVCFGKDGPLLASHCRSAGVSHVVAGNLSSATRQALAQVSSGGVVLLSPGCASFDEFRDFEERGREFKRYVHEECSLKTGSPI